MAKHDRDLGEVLGVGNVGGMLQWEMAKVHQAGLSQDDIEDMKSEATLRVLTRAAAIRRAHNPAGYCRSVVRRSYIDSLRRQVRLARRMEVNHG